MKVINRLRPVYWEDTAEYAYRLVSKNSVKSPGWVTPTSYATAIAHDIFDHVRWASPYNVEDSLKPYINEIWSAGVFSSHAPYSKYVAVCQSIEELTEVLPEYGKNSIDNIAMQFPLCRDELYNQKVILHSNNGWMSMNRLSDTETNLRLINVAYQGYCFGKKYPHIGSLRHYFETNWKTFFPGLSTLILEGEYYQDYYGIDLIVDFTEGSIESRKVRLRGDWKNYSETRE